METRGTLTDAKVSAEGKMILTFTVDNGVAIEDITGKDLDITAKPHREKRSLNANALLWACIGDIAKAVHADRWEIYLSLLKRYGKYTYVCVKPQAVEMLKRQWREVEEIGPIDIHGQTAMQLLCFYGSSTYNTEDFGHLLEGTLSEMKELGLSLPMPNNIRDALAQWEKQNEKMQAVG